MSPTCPVCRCTHEAGAKFCPDCGIKLTAGQDGRPRADSLDDLLTDGGLPTADRIERLPGGLELRCVRIVPGTFVMGSREEGREDERPAREVRIRRAYYLGASAVTQEQYQSLMGVNPSRFQGAPRRPVENVSWEEAEEFCRRLQAHLLGPGRSRDANLPEIAGVSLPTEAQWEHACRAGSAGAFSFGEERAALAEHGWFEKNAARTTHAVGLLRPNSWGLYDMHGNVWEWCADWYAPGYAGAGSVDPRGPATGGRRVLRGGSWSCLATECRCASRRSAEPQERTANYGFRVAMSVSEDKT